MSDPFARLHQSLFAGPLANGAKLNGVDVRIIFHRNFAILGEYGEIVARKTVAELPSDAGGVEGATLQVGVQTFVLDAQTTGDGYADFWVLRPV